MSRPLCRRTGRRWQTFEDRSSTFFLSPRLEVLCDHTEVTPVCLCRLGRPQHAESQESTENEGGNGKNDNSREENSW